MITVFEKNRVNYVLSENESVDVLYCGNNKKVIRFYGDDKHDEQDNEFEENYKMIIEEFLNK